jgi:DNA-binding XRE family transcriptional regulator
MKKIIKNKKKGITETGHTWYSFNEVFDELSKKPGFTEAFDEEMERFRLRKRLRALRMKKRMTQKVAAAKAGMPQSAVARIESGERGISVETLGRLAHVYGKEVQLV